MPIELKVVLGLSRSSERWGEGDWLFSWRQRQH